MTYALPKSIADALDFDLRAEIFDYRSALVAHAHTVDEPAPVALLLVETIVREHGGAFEIIDDTPVETAAQKRGRLAHIVQQELTRRSDAVSSPGRRNLAQIDIAKLAVKRDRTDQENARLAEVQQMFARITDIARHAALLQIEIEDLPEADLDGWQHHGWPT